MPEPTSTSSIGLLGLFVTLLGPLLGPYALILFGATLGAATALSVRDGGSTLGGLWFLLRVVLTALLFTSAVTAALERWMDWPADMVMGAVAYCIGWQWDQLSRRLWPYILRRLGLAPSEGGAQ